jgi:hypothetical protein
MAINEQSFQAENQRTRGSVGAALWVIAGILVLLFVFQVYATWTAATPQTREIQTTLKTTLAEPEYGELRGSEHIQKDVFQAIFLTDGQVYFGHITSVDEASFTLVNVFYLQADGELQGSAGETGDGLQLVKLGQGEVHGPQDLMVISRDQVMFWENLKPDSAVSQAIEDFDPDAVSVAPTSSGSAANTNSADSR